MKIAVLSDIHSNHIALESCIEYCLKENIENYIFLGDYISDNPYPQKTMDILYELDSKYNCTFILGNREEYFINYRMSKANYWKKGSSTGSLYYTNLNLRDKDIEFFSKLKNNTLCKYDGYPDIRICHGSLLNSRGSIYENNSELENTLKILKENYLLCGHTHHELDLLIDNKRIINPGSVGVCVNYANEAQFVVLQGSYNKWTPTFLQVPYDTNRLIIEHKESGLYELAPSWSKSVINLIKTNTNHTDDLIAYVKELNQDTYQWADIPEALWDQAIKKFNIEDL